MVDLGSLNTKINVKNSFQLYFSCKWAEKLKTSCLTAPRNRQRLQIAAPQKRQWLQIDALQNRQWLQIVAPQNRQRLQIKLDGAIASFGVQRFGAIASFRVHRFGAVASFGVLQLGAIACFWVQISMRFSALQLICSWNTAAMNFSHRFLCSGSLNLPYIILFCTLTGSL